MLKPLLILLLGLTGIVSGLLPGGLLEHESFQRVLMLAAFGVPVLAGVLALVKRRAEQWQFVATLACFVLAFVKLRVWNQLASFPDLGHWTQGMIIASVGGVAVSLIGLLKNEPNA